MVNEEENQLTNQVTLEIARELAIKGNYDESIELLLTLTDTEFSIEANILLAKIYAQRQDFKNAEKCFRKVLEKDENNNEALDGLIKCRQLKNSKIKTFFNYNKLKAYSIVIILLILLVGLVGVITYNSIDFTGSTNGEKLVDADLITINFNVNGDSQKVLSILTDTFNESKINIVQKNNSFTITTYLSEVNNILYILNNLDTSDNCNITLKSVIFSVSNNSKEKLLKDDYTANEKLNFTNNDNVQNNSMNLVSNYISLDENTNFSTQQQNIKNMLNDEKYSKVKVIS